jgi:hypothetical protein
MANRKPIWSSLVAERDAALKHWELTAAALAKLPAAAEWDSEEGRLHDNARLALDVCEDRLLAAIAPDLQGVALQLELFAQRFHYADLVEPISAQEVPEAGVLRRIRQAVVSASGAVG